jgi:sugar phosphate isomerase/epimerase
MQIEELDIGESIAQSGRWIRHVHVAENTRVEPGPGSMDFIPGFKALKELGYGGIIELECRTLSGPAEEVLPRSAGYIRRLWREA